MDGSHPRVKHWYGMSTKNWTFHCYGRVVPTMISLKFMEFFLFNDSLDLSHCTLFIRYVPLSLLNHTEREWCDRERDEKSS